MAKAATSPITAADIGSRRILRLALGTTLSMGFSQLINWPLSFMAAIITMFILALPLPAPSLKSGFKFSIALVLPAYAGMLLVPFLIHARWAGILMLLLAFFGSFYYTARGGSPVIGMFMTVGLTLVVAVGSVSAELLLVLINGLAVGALVGVIFVVIAHALLPDLPTPASAAATKPPPPAKPYPAFARRNALRSLLVVMPLVIFFLFSSSSIFYIALMIKVASMGQQANVQVSRAMGRDQLESTLWGGLGAIIAYQIIIIWPVLPMFCLLIAVACLLYGSKIFQGIGMHPRAGMWSYALLTMIIILTPAVTGSGDASGAFYTRLMLFIVIAFYGTISVAVFDAFWPQPSAPNHTDANPNIQPEKT
ncbi:MAG: DUF2955 domain-containing protein [Xanthomonadales bacterium]|nr:DUF2955 domain-containing protein [Xanthomonadales bacterium]